MKRLLEFILANSFFFFLDFLFSMFFSWPSSSRPTLDKGPLLLTVLHIGCAGFNAFQTKPKPCKTDGGYQIHNFGHISQLLSNFTILTKFHDFGHFSQFLPIFTILTKVHNFYQISQLQPNFTIPIKFQNFNQISQL